MFFDMNLKYTDNGVEYYRAKASMVICGDEVLLSCDCRLSDHRIVDIGFKGHQVVIGKDGNINIKNMEQGRLHLENMVRLILEQELLRQSIAHGEGAIEKEERIDEIEKMLINM